MDKTTQEPVFPMRINKYLAWKKQSTRRSADTLINEGKVFLNGQKAKLGDKVEMNDSVEVRFRGKIKPFVYLAYNKPKGVVTHSAQNGDKEIKDMVSRKNVFPMGRLDKDSEGLMILTDDGRITERLLSPQYFHEKEYLVKTKNKLRGSFKEKMEKGVELEDGKTRPCKVEIINEHTFKITLTEGRKHQIRRMCVALFQEVEELKRIRIMNITLGNLRPGAHRELKGKELQTFLHALEL